MEIITPTFVAVLFLIAVGWWLFVAYLFFSERRRKRGYYDKLAIEKKSWRRWSRKLARKNAKSTGIAIGRSAVLFLFELWLLVTTAFILFRVLFFDAQFVFMHGDAVFGDAHVLVGSYESDEPIIVQYLIFISDFLTGNYGTYLRYSHSDPVSIFGLVTEEAAWTGALLGLSVLITLFLGVFIIRRPRRTGRKYLGKVAHMLPVMIFILPAFVLAPILLYVLRELFPSLGFGFHLAWGFDSLSFQDKIVEIFTYFTIPLIVLVIAGLSFFILLVRERQRNIDDRQLLVSREQPDVPSDYIFTRKGLCDTFSSVLWTVPFLLGWMTFNYLVVGNFVYWDQLESELLTFFFYDQVGKYSHGTAAFIFIVLLVLLICFLAKVAKILIDSGLEKGAGSLENDIPEQVAEPQSDDISEGNPENSLLSKNGIKRILRAYSKNPVGIFALVCILLFIAMGAIAPFAYPEKFELILGYGAQPPSLDHIMGIDEDNQDVFKLFLWGSQVPLLVALVAIASSLVLGTALGATLSGISNSKKTGRIGRASFGLILHLFTVIPLFLLLFITWIQILSVELWIFLLIVAIFSFAPVALYSVSFYKVKYSGKKMSLRNRMREMFPDILQISKLTVPITILSYLFLSYYFPLRDIASTWFIRNQGIFSSISYGHWWAVFFPTLAAMLFTLSIYLSLDTLEKILRREIDPGKGKVPDGFIPL